MAVTNDDKIAKLEAKVASLRLQHSFLSDHIKMIDGKNPTLEAKVKAIMDWNQKLQSKVLGEVESKYIIVKDENELILWSVLTHTSSSRFKISRARSL